MKRIRNRVNGTHDNTGIRVQKADSHENKRKKDLFNFRDPFSFLREEFRVPF
jgi:hypothetical protein